MKSYLDRSFFDFKRPLFEMFFFKDGCILTILRTKPLSSLEKKNLWSGKKRHRTRSFYNNLNKEGNTAGEKINF